jgi:hypothetical protein
MHSIAKVYKSLKKWMSSHHLSGSALICCSKVCPTSFLYSLIITTFFWSFLYSFSRSASFVGTFTSRQPWHLLTTYLPTIKKELEKGWLIDKKGIYQVCQDEIRKMNSIRRLKEITTNVVLAFSVNSSTPTVMWFFPSSRQCARRIVKLLEHV